MKKKQQGATISKNKMVVTVVVIAMVFLALSMRLAYLMLIKSPEYSARAEEQWTNTLLIKAKRGSILDSNYKELAISGDVYRVDLDLTTIRNYIKRYNQSNKEQISMETIAKQLAEILEVEESFVLSKLNSKLESGADATSASLKRRIDKATAIKIKELKIFGVLVSEDTLRYYINDNLLSHVLGITNNDGEGLTGIEFMYNNVLEGTEGVRIAQVDSYNRDMPYIEAEYTEPIAGKDVVLTIDENIQYIADKAASEALEKHKAKAVTVIVMNPNNGGILALVNKPDYNLNNPREGAETTEELEQLWRNRAVSDAFEPGSIFKVITAIAALEEGIVDEHTTFECNGKHVINGVTINCWKPKGHGKQSLSDIIKNSCNPGFMQLGEMLGKETLQKYIKLLGFGQSTGIDLPGEGSGIIKDLESMSAIDLATISFGHTNSVISVQYMAAFNAIANGGTWITPHLLKEVVTRDSHGTIIVDNAYNQGQEKRLLREDSTALLRTYLERVVTEGSGMNAYIEGYNIAGKTGTAEKVVNGEYGKDKYISTFVGMAPFEKPQVTIMVTIDEPSTGAYYAGEVAAPVAKQVLGETFNYLSLKTDYIKEQDKLILRDVIIPDLRGMTEGEAAEVLKKEGLNYSIEGEGPVIKDMSPAPGYSIKERSKIKLILGSGTDNREVVVPNLIGYSKQGAMEALSKLKLKAEFTGEGMVTKQSISPKEYVAAGTTITLTLEYTVGD